MREKEREGETERYIEIDREREHSGSKVGASSVLGSGPISNVCLAKDASTPVLRSGPLRS